MKTILMAVAATAIAAGVVYAQAKKPDPNAAKPEPNAVRPVPPPPTTPTTATPPSMTDNDNLPPDLLARGEKAGIWKDHPIDFTTNPFYLRGDFDGDHKVDYVVRTRNATDKEDQLVVLRGKGKELWIASADLPALDGWYVVDKGTKVDVGATGGKPPTLKGDGIMVSKAESSSALVYWTGKKFATYWQGD